MDNQRERAMRRSFFTGELQQDVVYAFRTLRRNLGFTGVIVFALALGIGANTSIFTLINAVLVRTHESVERPTIALLGEQYPCVFVVGSVGHAAAADPVS